MKELKFLRVLSQLSKPELQKFKKFLDSPYCNSNPILSLLFSAVVSVETGSVNESVDKSNVWKPKGIVNAKHFAKLQSMIPF